MKSSAKTGQSQLLIPLLVIITSAVVFATNVTMNWTNQTPITGYYMGIPNSSSQEFSFTIEVWANTSISLSKEGDLIKSVLLMDNGSAVPGQKIDFFLNNSPIYSDTTDKNGLIDFPLPFNGTARAVFSGGNYLNPSENEMVFGGKAESVVKRTDSFVLEVLEVEQGEIKIGEPVKWIREFKLTNPKDKDSLAELILDIPDEAFNITVSEKGSKKLVNIAKKIIKENLKAGESREYLLEYYTDSPVLNENLISRYRKLINVSSPIHYSNVPAYTDIEESPIDSIRLYWISDGQRIDVTGDPLYNVSFVDSDGDGLIDRLEWNVPHLSEQLFEVSITVLNPYTYLKDGDNWIVAFETVGTANLTINSTNAGWIEFLTDNLETFDEMSFLDIRCGDASLKDSLQLIDFYGNVYNYSDLSDNNSIEIEHLFIQNYSCDETGYITNNMIRSGYATLQFTFGDQTAFAYDPAVVCNWSTDTVNWADQQGGGGSAWGVANTTWNVGTNCSQAGGPSTGCYIANISINMYGASASPASGGLGFVIFSNNSTQFFPMAIDKTGAYTYGPVDSCGASNNLTGSGWPSGPPNATPNTCNLSSTSRFNVTRYTVNWYIPGKGSISIPTIKYQWCWEDAFPKLDNPVVNGSQSSHSSGWGSTFNFSVALWEPQRQETNVSLWYTQTAGTGWMFAGSRNMTNPSNQTPGNMTNLTMKFLCTGGTITDEYSNDLGVLGAGKYYKFNATDSTSNKNDTYNTYGNIYFIPTKDNVTVTNLTPTADVTINRTDTTSFVVRVYDSENQSYDAGQSGKIWISTYTYNQNTSFLTSTNDTGHLVQSFSNAVWCEGAETNQYYLGVHHWGGGTESDSCVKNNLTEKSNFTLMGSLYNTLNEPDGTSNFTQDDTIDFTVSVLDDCGEDRKIDSTVNITMSHDGTEYWCIASAAGECSIDTDITFPTGWYNVTVVSNKTYHNNGYSLDQDLFYLDPYRGFFNETVDPSSAYYSYNNWNFSVNATSGNTDQMNITLYLRPATGGYSKCTSCLNQTTIECVNCFNQTYYWYRNFTSEETGTWYYQFRMYNHSTGYLETQTTEKSFYVDPVPEIKIFLEDVTQTPPSAQWGGTPFTFNVTVNTTGVNNATVFLWVGNSSGGPWTLIGQENYTIPGSTWQTLNFTNYFGCGDIGTKWFFFNTTNYNMSVNSTTPQSFTITKDTIYLDYSVGYNTTANRAGSQTDLLVFRATNANGTYMSNFPIKYYVTSANTSQTYYSDESFVNGTNSTGHANFYFDPTCLEDYDGAPKFRVGEQQWRAQLNDSELSCYYQNTSSDYIYRNLSVKGNILITITNPDGTANVTQLSPITFLGYSYDDCDDALKLNVTPGYEEIKYYANNSTTYGFDCGQSTIIGANAYQCNWQTNINTPTQAYNGSMFVNRTNYYLNQTLEDAGRGWLFYVIPFREFSGKSVSPMSDLWDHENWNFSVNATSGDYNNETIVLQLKKGSEAWQNCEDVLAECSNMTATNCTHCVNQTYFWHANFTESDAGTWFYKFQMNNSDTLEVDYETSGTDSFNVLLTDVKIFLENVTKYPSSGSWGGGNFTFNVTVNTTGINNATVFLWISNSSDGPWTLLGQKNYTIGGSAWQTLNFSKRFDCSDIGTKYFFFNTTNYNGSKNLTTSQSFTITKDDVIIEYISGNNTTANRKDGQEDDLSVRFKDGNNTLLEGLNVTYYIETNSYVYDSGNSILVDSDGFANYSFNPTCTDPRYDVGHQNWKVAVAPNEYTCYQVNDTDSAGFALNLTVMGDFNISFLWPQTDNKTIGDQVRFEASIWDDCQVELGTTTVRYNATNALFNDECSVVTSPVTGYYACAETPGGWSSTGAREGWYNATINATKSFYYSNITTKSEQGIGHFYLKLDPVLSSQTVTPSSGGWANDRNFSVNVTDDLADNVTVKLWHRSPGGTGSLWEQINGAKWCTDCNNTNVNWTDIEYNCSFVGTVDYKFNATDEESNAHEISASFTIANDNVSVTNQTPIGSAMINRTSTTYFIVELYDTENASYPLDAEGKIWLTTSDVATWESDVDAPTRYSNMSGQINRSMGPIQWGCEETYVLGNHYWKGGSYGSNCPPGLKDNVTGNVLFTLMGTLSNTLQQPLGTQNFTVGSDIHLNGTVLQDGSCGAATGASVDYNITNGTHAFTCSALHQGNGIFNCSWNSAGKSTGWYNVTMISYDSNFHNGTASQTNAFYLRSPILLEDLDIDPDGGGSYGYSPFNFSVNVTASDDENVTVYLYLYNSTHSWLDNQSYCTNCDNTYFEFSKSYDCANIDSWQYKFNATSDTGASNNSLSPAGFSVTADTISIVYGSGNESNVNRSDSMSNYETSFIVRVLDTVKNQYVTDVPLGNVHAYAKINSTTWMELAGSLGTVGNNSTHYNTTFNPNCSFAAGKREWKFNVSSATCYANAESSSYNVTVHGNLSAYYLSPTGGAIYDLGDSVSLSGNLSDECSNDISGSNVQFQLDSDSSTYYCDSPGNLTGNVYSCNWDSTGNDVSLYNVTMISWNNSYNNGTDFEQDAFEIRSIPDLNGADVNPRADGWVKNFNFTVNVTDNLGDNVTVYLWESDDGSEPWTQIGSLQQCENCSNKTLWWIKNYTCSDKANGVSFKFNATDTESNSYETSLGAGDYVGDSRTFNIEMNNIGIEYISGNETNASTTDPTLFVVRVYDIDNSSSYLMNPSATIAFNVTKQGFGSSFYTVGGNSTNSTGYVHYYFLPDQTFASVKQNWTAFTSTSEGCYKINTSGYYNVTTQTHVPLIENETVDIITGGWGDQRTFNVSVYDANDTANVSMWKASNIVGPWNLVHSDNYTDIGNWENFSFLINYTCGDKGTWYYKFNVSDSLNNTNTTAESLQRNYTINKDAVIFEDFYGNNSIANRSANQTDMLYLRLRDGNGTYLSNFNGTFYVTLDQSTGSWPSTGVENFSNSSGYVHYYFNPGCSPKNLVGDQLWKVEVGDSCYETNSTNTSGVYLNLSVMGSINLTFNRPNGLQNFTQEDSILFQGFTYDDCDNSLVPNVTFYANNSTTYSAECSDVQKIGENVFECSWQTTIETTRGWYNTTMQANKSYHYNNFSVNYGSPGLFYLKPVYKIENVSGTPTTQGWGYLNWNFTTKVSSGDPDTSYPVLLYMNKGSPEFTLSCSGSVCLNQTPVDCIYPDCVNQTVFWLRNFTYDDQGTWFFKFELDGEETSGNDIVSVVKDSINITHNLGNNEIVNRSGYQSQMFIVYVNDTVRNQSATNPYTTVYFNVTNNSINYKTYGSNSTNGTGYSNVSFNPDCTYSNGTQNWFGYVYGDSNYNNANSSIFNISIYGDLEPKNVNTYNSTGITDIFFTGDTVNITGYVEDDCDNPISNETGINVTFEIYKNSTYPPQADTFCFDVTYFGNGVYNCLWNSQAFENGTYIIRMNASNVSFHNNGTHTKWGAFGMEVPPNTPPVVENASVTPDPGGWGSVFNFSVDVTDEDPLQNVTVFFWESPDGVAWSLIDNQTCADECTEASSTTMYFIKNDYSCQEQGTRYFKFNASDNSSTANKDSLDDGPYDFNVTKDNIQFLSVVGNEGTVNRSGNQNVFLAIMINDTTRGVLVTSNVTAGRFWVTYDENAWDVGSANRTTNSSSYMNYTFNPNCTPRYNVSNSQKWMAGVLNDTCYVDTNSSNYSLTIKGDLSNSIIGPAGEVAYDPNNITLLGNITSDCNDDSIIDANVTFKLSHEAFTYYAYPNPANNNITFYNATHNVTGTPGGNYSITINSSRSLYNPHNTTTSNAFHHEVDPLLTNEYVSAETAAWGTTFDFYTAVTDDDDTANLTLWIRCTGGNTTNNPDFICSPASNFTAKGSPTSQTCEDCNNQQKSASWISNIPGHIGNYEWFFNVSDLYGGSNNTTVKTFNVTRRNVYFNIIQGNNSNVSRIGTNKTLLQVKLVDAFDDGEIGGVQVKFYVTLDGSVWDSSVLNTTDITTGYGDYYFNPGCPSPFYKTGRQWWRVAFDQTNAYTTGSSANYTVNINSTLNGTVIYPTGQTVFSIGDNIHIIGELRDECEYITNAGSVVFRSGGWSCSPEPANNVGNGTYNCSLDTGSLGVGIYNITMNSSKSYYYDDYTVEQNAFEIRKYPELSNESITPDTEGWGFNYTINLSVHDTDTGDNVNISLWKSVGGGEWTYVASQICSSGLCTNPTSFNFYPQFNCNDYTNGPDINFKFNASDDYGLSDETSNFSATFQKDNVTFTIIQGGGIINRETETRTFTVIVNDSDRNNESVNNSQEVVDGNFWFSYNSAPTYDEGHSVQTNTTGHMSHGFDPNCTYEVGTEYWYVGISGNGCYADTATGQTANTYVLRGQLKSSLYEPMQYDIFNVTDNVTLKWNVYSDCSNEGNITSVSNTVELNNYGNESSCASPQEGALSGNYNCTWDSTGEPEGNWTVNISASNSDYYSNFTSYSNWLYLDNLNATGTDPTVNPSSGGWGTTYTYNITVNDSENDTASCMLYTNTNGTWVYKGIDTITTPDNCSISVNNFNCQDQGTGSYYFIINDTYNVINTSETLGTTSGPNIGKDTVTVTQISEGGYPNYYVNRSSDQTTTMVLLVNDTIKNEQPNNTNVTVWVTTDGSVWDSGNVVNTNNTGYASYIFNPNCSAPFYDVGNQTWIAGTSDYCYEDTNTTSNFSMKIYGDILSTVIEPIGSQTFLRGSNVTIRTNTTDDCQTPINIKTINMTSIQGASEYGCSSIENETDTGFYNCTFNTSSPFLMPARYYKIRVNTTKDDHNYGDMNETDAFFIETEPVIQNESVSPEESGWGSTYTFTVNFTDEDLDTNTVTVWFRKCTDETCTAHSPDWSGANSISNSSVSGINVSVSFNKDWICDDIGYWQYKFNASDSRGYTDETSIHQFNLTRDDIVIEHFYGNNTTFNRSISESRILSVRIWDINRGIYIGSPPVQASGKFWVTNNTLNNFIEVFSTVGSDTSYMNRTWSPDCTFEIGPQKWKVNITNDGCYQDNTSQDFKINITTYPLVANIIQPKNNVTFLKRIDNILIKGNVTDDCSATLGKGVINATVTFTAEKINDGFYRSTPTLCSVYNESDGEYNCTILNTTHAGVDWNYGTYNITMNATKNYYNNSITKKEQDSFILASKPELKTITVSSTQGGSTGGWGEKWTYSIELRDNDTNAVNVSLWAFNLSGTNSWAMLNSTVCDGSGSNPICPNPTSSFQTITFSGHNFTCSNLESLYTRGIEFKFNASDILNYTNQSSNSTFNLERDNVFVEHISGTENNVNREGDSTTQLVLQVQDIDRNYANVGSGVNTKMFVTYNQSQWDTGENKTTDSNGYINYSFNATCSYETGPQWWRGGTYEDSCYKPTNSSNWTVYVWGQLKNNIQLPTYGSNYFTGNPVTLRFNTTSDCPSENLIANSTYASIETSLSGSTWFNCTDLNNEYDGWYNCTWTDTLQTPGAWDIRLNSSKSSAYYSSNSTVYTDWFSLVNSPPNYSGQSVTPSSGGWGTSFNYSVNVTDVDSDNMNCTLFIYTNGAWTNRGITSLSPPYPKTCSFVVDNLTCNDIGTNNWFKWELSDEVNTNNTTNTTGPNVTANSIELIHLFGDGEIVNRTYGNLDLKVFANDTVRNSGIGTNGTPNVTVYYNITVNGTDYINEGSVSTVNGNATLNFAPTCSDYDVGLQDWFSYVLGDGCYADQNSSVLNLTVYGSVVPLITAPSGEKYLRGENDTLLRGNLTNDCDQAFSNATVNFTAIHQNSSTEYICSSTNNEDNGNYNCTILNTTHNSWSAGYYNVKFNITADYHNYNTTTQTYLADARGFLLETKPLLTAPSVSSSGNGGWGETWRFSVNVTDQ
ncbi:MAG: hypothetical protein V1818_04740, partial [Candidatus Aenigmatarchaeota archaeon]